MRMLLLVLMGLVLASSSMAASFIVEEDYAELRVGPGAHYPLFQALERGEKLELIKRSNSWLKLRASNGVSGWMSQYDFVQATHIAGRSFKAPRYELIASAGWLGGDAVYSLAGGYRLGSFITPMLGISRSVGEVSSSTLYQAQLEAEVFRFSRIQPYVAAGLGVFDSQPLQTQAGRFRNTSATFQLGGGFAYVFSSRFYARTGVSVLTLTTASVEQSAYFSWQTGVSAFF